jgi:tetratricopeptide (TPR) repeat protein
MEWHELRGLLDQPQRLKSEVEVLRKAKGLSEEMKGFIALYDHFHGDVSKIKNYLTTSGEYIQQPIERKKTHWSQWNKIAAVSLIVILSVIGYVLFRPLPISEKQTKKLVVEYLIEPGIPVYMSQHPKLSWQKVMFPYKKGAYKQALHELNKLEKSAPQNDTVLYFIGVLSNKMKNLKKANLYFKRTIAVKSFYSYRAHFYLAKMAWEAGRKQMAHNKLIELKTCDDPTVQQAVHAFLNDHPLNAENSGKKE